MIQVFAGLLALLVSISSSSSTLMAANQTQLQESANCQSLLVTDKMTKGLRALLDTGQTPDSITIIVSLPHPVLFREINSDVVAAQYIELKKTLALIGLEFLSHGEGDNRAQFFRVRGSNASLRRALSLSQVAWAGLQPNARALANVQKVAVNQLTLDIAAGYQSNEIVRIAKQRFKDLFFYRTSSRSRIKGINGVGIGGGLRVLVLDQTTADLIPSFFEGVKVEVSISGNIRPQTKVEPASSSRYVFIFSSRKALEAAKHHFTRLGLVVVDEVSELNACLLVGAQSAIDEARNLEGVESIEPEVHYSPISAAPANGPRIFLSRPPI